MLVLKLKINSAEIMNASTVFQENLLILKLALSINETTFCTLKDYVDINFISKRINLEIEVYLHFLRLTYSEN